MKIIGVSSSGGHLLQLSHLFLNLNQNHEVVICTFDKPDSTEIQEKFRFHGLRFPTNRRIINNLFNLYIAFRIVLNERPQLIVSTGAAPALSFVLPAKILRIKFLYIEPIDRVFSPTLTAKLLKYFGIYFFVFWDTQLPDYPNRRVLSD